jgi:glycosyltransferase involved in cell wall biosynthesis
VVFSAGDWWIHSHGHADSQLALNLARLGHSVLVVNSMGLGVAGAPGRNRWSRVVRKLRSMLRPFTRVNAKLAVLSPVFLPVFGNGWLARLNARIVAIQVSVAIRLLRFSKPHVVVANPTAGPVASLLKWTSKTFYCVDDYASAPEADARRIKLLVDRLSVWSDVILYSSQVMFEREGSKFLNKRVRFPHGVDLVLFDPGFLWPEPEDLASIARPRICMVGNLEDVDRQQQIAAVAAELWEMQFVLVGSHQVLDESLRRSNVHLLGMQPHEKVPQYLAHVDVGLLCVPRNEWGAAAEPVKIKEYLAMGLPVVANDFVGWEKFRDEIQVGATTAAIAIAIRSVIADNTRLNFNSRRQSVLVDSWSTRATELVEILNRIPIKETADV